MLNRVSLALGAFRGGVAMPTTNKGFLVAWEDLPYKNDRQDLCTFVCFLFLFFFLGGGGGGLLP